MKSIILTQEQIHTGNLILVNAQYPYHDLPEISLKKMFASKPNILLSGRIVNNLTCLMEEINGWEHITAVSGWRSMDEQIKIYEESLLENGQFFTEKYVALPGHSEHQTGLAIDLAKTSDSIDFIRPDFPYMGVCQTFRNAAPSYGFIERYPKEKEAVTGIAHEPWHFRYVGIPHAKIMSEKGLVLEEYVDYLKDYEYGTSAFIYGSEEWTALISYLPALPDAETQLTIDDRFPYSISGNNMDGFIITQWRNRDGSE